MSAAAAESRAQAPQVVDAYSHVCPLELIDAVEQVKPSPEVRALRQNSYQFDLDRRVAYMDSRGVDVQVLVLVRPPMWLGMEAADVRRLTRIANEGIGRLAADRQDRFVGVGVLPIVDASTLADFQTAREEFDLRGVCIFSNIEGRPIDEAPMWELYEYAAATALPIWIHPQHGPYYPWLKRDLLDRIFGWPFETTVAMARLVYSGVFERFPELRVVTHHFGGMLPFYGHRASDFYDEVREYAERGIGDQSPVRLSGNIEDHFKRFYCDCNVSGSDAALRCGLDFFGAEHVLFGSDFPMGPHDGEAWADEILGAVRTTRELDDHQRALILGGNATRLLGLETGVGERRAQAPA